MQDEHPDRQRCTEAKARQESKSDNAPARRADATLTRRGWLLKLGEAAVLCGFSGAAEELITATASSPSGEVAHKLPGGLYEPSNDHLSHALTSDARFHPIPARTETDYARPRNGPFQPQFFSRKEFATVGRIVELMLGESGAPRESVAGSAKLQDTVTEVAEWIDLCVSSSAAVRQAASHLAPEHRTLAAAYYGAQAVEELENSDPQKIWREGLQWLDEQSQRQPGGNFLSLNEDQQIELLKSVSDDRPNAAAENAGTRLFRTLKEELIRGFYTSSAGLKELNYKGNAFYAESPGCAANKDKGEGSGSG